MHAPLEPPVESINHVEVLARLLLEARAEPEQLERIVEELQASEAQLPPDRRRQAASGQNSADPLRARRALPERVLVSKLLDHLPQPQRVGA